MKLIKNKKRVLIIALIALDVLLLAVVALVILYRSPAKLTEREKLERLIGEGAEQMSETQFEEARLGLLSEGMEKIYYNAVPELVNGAMNILISNAEDNECSVSVEIKLLDTGEQLAVTDLIDPGYRVETVPCAIELTDGTYECLMIVKVYASDNTYLGEAGRHLSLSVK